MLSIGKIKGSETRTAAEYYQNKSAAVEDYYSAKQESPGVWHGAGCEALGLTEGAAVGDEFQTILDGFHAKDGTALTQNAGTTKRVSAFDLTFSAGKDISILAGLASPEIRGQIVKAHKDAVNRTMQYLEDNVAMSRRGANGKGVPDKVSICFAQFGHMSSRGGPAGIDPDLHDHNILINTVQRPDGTFGTLDSSVILPHTKALGAAYRAELGYNLRKLGIEIESVTDKKDNVYIQVVGFDKDLVKSFSQRRDQIEKAFEEFKLKTNSTLSDTEIKQNACLITRKTKDEPTPEELETQWASRARELGFTQDYFDSFRKNVWLADTDRKVFDYNKVVDELTDKNVMFSRQDILKAVAHEAIRNGYSLDEAEAITKQLTASPEIVLRGYDEKNKPIYTTKTMIECEKRLYDTVKERVSDTSHRIPADAVTSAINDYNENLKRSGKTWQISLQQENALRFILSDSGGYAAIQGKAGAGKTTIMQVANQCATEAGYTVIGCAPSNKASQQLEKDSGIKSFTVDTLLKKLELGQLKLSEKTILVLDESGMVGSKNKDKLMQYIADAKAKAIGVGDTEQLSPVSSGPSFKTSQRASQDAGQDVYALDEIRRQNQRHDINSAHDFAKGQAAEGLAEYYKRGRISFSENTMQTVDRMTDDTITFLKQYNADKNSENTVDRTVCLANTNIEVDLVNRVMHEKLKEHNLVVKASTETTVETENGTRHFCLGERVIFKENVSLMNERGYKKKTGVSNGHTGTLKAIAPLRNGDTELTVYVDERKKDITFRLSEFNNVDYAYAMTTYKSQGQTLKDVKILAGGTMADKSIFYVQMTRHKDEATVYLAQDTLTDLIIDAAPTRTMVQHAEALAEQHQQKLSEECYTDFSACRTFIEERTPGYVDTLEYRTRTFADIKDAANLQSSADFMTFNARTMSAAGADINTIATALNEPAAKLQGAFEKSPSLFTKYLERYCEQNNVEFKEVLHKPRADQEIEALATLAEIVSQKREKESTLDFINVKAPAPEPSQDQIATAEKIKLLARFDYDKTYDDYSHYSQIRTDLATKVDDLNDTERLILSKRELPAHEALQQWKSTPEAVRKQLIFNELANRFDALEHKALSRIKDSILLDKNSTLHRHEDVHQEAQRRWMRIPDHERKDQIRELYLKQEMKLKNKNVLRLS